MDGPLDFRGRRAAVTGAAGGIGRAVADLLRERGAEVVRCDLAVENGVAADLATTEGRAALVDATGPCDHLVIAHGIVRPKPITETTEEDWDAILDVNAKAVYFLCKAFGALLRDGGSIVTLSSVSARSAASQEQSVYCASKAAVSSITRSFAHAYAARDNPRQYRPAGDRRDGDAGAVPRGGGTGTRDDAGGAARGATRRGAARAHLAGARDAPRRSSGS